MGETFVNRKQVERLLAGPNHVASRQLNAAMAKSSTSGKRKPVVKASISPLAVRVRRSGTGYTVRAQGQSASCEWSAAQAARKLAEKIGFKPGFDVARVGPAADGDGDIWNIVEVQP